MAKEIERKFLIDVRLWGLQGTPVKIEQAYLSVDDKKIIRIRIAGDCAYITIKGNKSGISRDEFEYSVPVEDAEQLMLYSVGYEVSKTRYMLFINGDKWEIDVFHGLNDGLVVAEIELQSEDQLFEKPEWIKEEVSDDGRYYNFNLSKLPFSMW